MLHQHPPVVGFRVRGGSYGRPHGPASRLDGPSSRRTRTTSTAGTRKSSILGAYGCARLRQRPPLRLRWRRRTYIALYRLTASAVLAGDAYQQVARNGPGGVPAARGRALRDRRIRFGVRADLSDGGRHRRVCQPTGHIAAGSARAVERRGADNRMTAPPTRSTAATR